MRPVQSLIVAGALGSLALSAPAGIITDDFESHTPGQFPGDPWHDIAERGVTNPATDPSMFVVQTIDAQGNLTNALQTTGAYGTNGFYADIEQARHHTVSMDVRIDRLADPGEGWPLGVGFMHGLGADDVNRDPHAVIYAWTDRRWRLFVSMGAGLPAMDVLITQTRFTLDSWYTLELSVDTETGLFNASVSDAASGDLIGSIERALTGWDAERGNFNAVGMFDGELPNTDSFGRATVDNVNYVPSPAGAMLSAPAMLLGARRRRSPSQ